MKWFKKTFIHSPIRYIIAAGLALSLVLVYLILNGFNALTYYYNACFASGMIVYIVTTCNYCHNRDDDTK